MRSFKFPLSRERILLSGVLMYFSAACCYLMLFVGAPKREVAEKFFAAEMETRRLKKIATELEEVREFYDAEEEHQQVSYIRAPPQRLSTTPPPRRPGGCQHLAVTPTGLRVLGSSNVFPFGAHLCLAVLLYLPPFFMLASTRSW